MPTMVKTEKKQDGVSEVIMAGEPENPNPFLTLPSNFLNFFYSTRGAKPVDFATAGKSSPRTSGLKDDKAEFHELSLVSLPWKSSTSISGLKDDKAGFHELSSVSLPDRLPPQTKIEMNESTPREEEAEARTVSLHDEETKSPKPSVVKLPCTQQAISDLKIEAREGERSSNPLILWQVYALGGFLVLRWIWGRWRERRDGKGQAGDGTEDVD